MWAQFRAERRPDHRRHHHHSDLRCWLYPPIPFPTLIGRQLPLEPDGFRAKFWPVASAVVANHPNSVAVPPSTDPYHRPALWHCRSAEPVRATLAASEPPFGLDSGHGLGNRCCQCDHRLATDLFRTPMCSVVPLHRSSSSGHYVGVWVGRARLCRTGPGLGCG